MTKKPVFLPPHLAKLLARCSINVSADTFTTSTKKTATSALPTIKKCAFDASARISDIERSTKALTDSSRKVPMSAYARMSDINTPIASVGIPTKTSTIEAPSETSTSRGPIKKSTTSPSAGTLATGTPNCISTKIYTRSNTKKSASATVTKAPIKMSTDASVRVSADTPSPKSSINVPANKPPKTSAPRASGISTSTDKPNSISATETPAINTTSIGMPTDVLAEPEHNILNQKLSSNFPSFLHKVFNTLHPTVPYIDNWHTKLICEYLDAIQRRDVKRLIINLPPRSLKSICISVAWPAWLLGHAPATKIIAVSYSKALSLKHGEDFRKVISTQWYQDLFPNTVVSHTTKDKVQTTLNGFRFNTSVGATLTGEGADIIIIDDPQTPLQAMSANARDKLYDWLRQTLFSRLNDWETGAVLLVMQRLHEEDLTGKLLRYNKSLWSKLLLPAIAERDEHIKFGQFSYHRSHGEILSPQLSKHIEQIQQELGSFAFTAQYQQHAIDNGSYIMERRWFHYYDPSIITAANCESIYQSWDCAIKTGTNNDYTVCSTWGEINNNYYLLDIYRQKLAYPYLKKTVIDLAAQFNPQAILIEDKASGQQLLQELKCSFPVISIMPKGDKITRLLTATSFFESAQIRLPTGMRWLEALEHELLSFPHSPHDDQVDSITQFIHWVNTRTKVKQPPRIRRL